MSGMSFDQDYQSGREFWPRQMLYLMQKYTYYKEKGGYYG